MNIISARYTEDTNISAFIDGISMLVPSDPSNRHYQALLEWVESGGVIDPYETPEDQIPEFVTSRQFKSQLSIDGIKDIVEEWVSQQHELIRISYENSSNFYREEPMMHKGFTDLGFTEEQIKKFFLDASKF